MPHSDLKILQLAIRLLKQGHSADIPASGRSMFPWLLPSDRLRITPLPLAQIRRGDVVVFVSRNQLVAHRVVRLTPHTLICRGDALLHHDEPVAVADYLGKVTHFQRKSKPMQPLGLFRFKVARILALYGYPCVNHLWVRAAHRLCH